MSEGEREGGREGGGDRGMEGGRVEETEGWREGGKGVKGIMGGRSRGKWGSGGNIVGGVMEVT